MAQTRLVPCLYQEVRLSPGPASPSSVLHIDTQSSSRSASRKRPFDEIGAIDEESYARKNLASEASVFFRHKGKLPRSFLWRVLDGRQLLQLQSVDLMQERKSATNDSVLSYHIAFPAPISPGGVAFADAEETDALDVFVLTTGNELYTITLKKDLLTQRSAPKDFDSSTCVRKHILSSLSFRRPYRFVAVSGLELLISLHDGGLMRLERRSHERGGEWKETYFSEGGWSGTLRGLIPLKRHQTIRYGELELEPAAAAVMAKSLDGGYIWTVGLDHTLTAWDAGTGKVAARCDLLGEKQDLEGQKRQLQYAIPAEQGSLLRVIPFPSRGRSTALAKMHAGNSYYLLVYSPKERTFKLYNVTTTTEPTRDEAPDMRDVLNGGRLSLPFDELLDTNLWRLEEFHINPGELWENTQIWARVRSGPTCKVFTLNFDLFDETGGINDDLQRIWETGWSVVDPGPLSPDRLREAADCPVLHTNSTTTLTEEWLEYLLYPGRFAEACLETALSSYRKRRKLPSSSGKGLGSAKQSLKERLSTSVSSRIMFHRLPNDTPDYNRYHADLQAQWSGLHSILLDLHNQRSEFLSLALDHETGLAWSVHADLVAPVRSNDRLELLDLNADFEVDPGEVGDVEFFEDRIYQSEDDRNSAILIAAARQFTFSLPVEFMQTFRKDAIQETVDVQNNSQKLNNADAFFEKTDVGAEVTEMACQALESALEPLNGVQGIDNNVFLAVLLLLDDDASGGPKTGSGYELNRYGGKLTITAAQQFIQQTESVLVNLLALVAFLKGDYEAEDLDPGFDPVRLYDAIMPRLKQIELRHWLARNVCFEESHGELILTTVFEYLFIGDWKAPALQDLTFPERLTQWSRQWAFAELKHGFADNVFAVLLRSGFYDLATDFTQFLQSSPWTTYLQARLQLAVGEYELAAIGFHNAAEGLARPGKSQMDTAGFLTPEELLFMGAGLDQYYMHVESLFERSKVFAHSADFAMLAMKHTPGGVAIDRELAIIDGRKSRTDSPASQRVADTREELRLLKSMNAWDDMAGRLFNALVQTGRFEDAYSALLNIKRPDLRRSNLQKLIDGCVNQDAMQVLLGLPLEGDLADAADDILLKLAKRNLSAGSAAAAAARPYDRALYAFRTRRGDFRGAAEILHESLERARHGGGRKGVRDLEDETLLHAYLLLINALACCGEGEGWLLAEPLPDVQSADGKRRLVTLEDVRSEYAAELDVRSDLHQGRFPLIGGDDDAMDVLQG